MDNFFTVKKTQKLSVNLNNFFYTTHHKTKTNNLNKKSKEFLRDAKTIDIQNKISGINHSKSTLVIPNL